MACGTEDLLLPEPEGRRRLEEECQRLDEDLQRVASEWQRLWEQRGRAMEALGTAPRPLPMRSTLPAELDPSITLQAPAPVARRCGSPLVGEP